MASVFDMEACVAGVIMNVIAKKLKELRLKQGLSVQQVSLILDVRAGVYESVEACKTEISARHLMKLCAYYGVGLEVFEERGDVVGKPRAAAEQVERKTGSKAEAAGRKIGGKGGRGRSRGKKAGDFRSPLDEEAEEGAGWASRHRERSPKELAKLQEKYPGMSVQEMDFLDLVAEIMVSATMEGVKDQGLLEASPGGYHPEQKKACGLCGDFVSGEQAWFNALGHLCLFCRDAISRGDIPAEVVKDHDLFYTDVQLESNFNIDRKAMKWLLRDGYLVPRVVKNGSGKVHFRLFLLQDNGAFLPPKSLLKWGWYKEVHPERGEEFVFGPWYYFVDDPVGYLKDHGISAMLRFRPLEEGDKLNNPGSDSIT